MIENMRGIRDIVTTLSLQSNKPFFVSPLTFKKRKNHDGPISNRHDRLDFSDDRQNSFFGAAWMLLAICNFHEAETIHIFNPEPSAPLNNLLNEIKSFDPESFYFTRHSIVLKNSNLETLEYKLPAEFYWQ